jgi:hypothetical protein
VGRVLGMKLNGGEVSRLLLFIFVLVVSFGGWAEEAKKSGKAVSKDELHALVQKTSLKLFKAINSNDHKFVMSLIDEKFGIYYGADNVRKHEEVLQDFEKKSGIYCRLFPCKSNQDKSVYEYFSKIKVEDLKIKIVGESEYKEYIFYTIRYDWPGRPKNLHFWGLPNLELRYDINGKKMAVRNLFVE